jgi:hypothetical protein
MLIISCADRNIKLILKVDFEVKVETCFHLMLDIVSGVMKKFKYKRSFELYTVCLNL